MKAVSAGINRRLKKIAYFIRLNEVSDFFQSSIYAGGNSLHCV